MKRILFILLLCLSASFTYAQRTANVALSSGLVNYVGDLGHERYFPYSSANIGSAITIREFFNNASRARSHSGMFDMQLRFSWHRLQYDETSPLGGKQGMELRNYLRGIGFRNDLFGSEIDFTYSFFIDRSQGKPRFSFFLLAGAGVFYGQPTADLFKGDASPENRYFFWKDGTIRNVAENDRGAGEIIQKDGEYETNLSKWNTEGQGYSNEVHTKQPYKNVNVGFPFGAGIRYMYNKYLTFSAEFNYYYFLTDYLDDVSGRYASYDELKSSFSGEKYEMAKYISDPTGLGTGGIIATASPRGNPERNDGFTYLSLEVAYKIVWMKRGVYGQK